QAGDHRRGDRLLGVARGDPYQLRAALAVFRLAVLVTLVLWLPDLYILDLGRPGRAGAVLIFIHPVIALIPVNCLLRLARTQPLVRHRGHAGLPGPDPARYAGRGM